MIIRQDIAELLHAGRSDREIAAQLHMDTRPISAVRAALGLPKARSGKKPAPTLEAAFLRHTKTAGDGHMEWTGHVQADGSRGFRWQGRYWTAAQAAFMIANGRAPEGKSRPVCDREQCIAPGHVQDRAGRLRLATEMLAAGHSAHAVIRRYQLSFERVRSLRDELGLPPHQPGTKPESINDTFRRRAVPTDDGHLLWPTSDYHIRTVEGAAMSARQHAFRQKHGRAPVGNVTAGCGTPRCVHPDHVEDRPMREALTTQLNLIFGSAA
ncbi:hypothetical protein [Streptomyces sp. CC208A]|uniref:hypothetical protein n=1 Tax=Streptomyces sp. CC208A TaxID=3044573 RepID=UPI0024A924B3|nr:hypothetical protein [Streptomyces sp. CC208A]